MRRQPWAEGARLWESDAVSRSVRTPKGWFVAAAFVAATAAGLHLYRSAFGGDATALPLAIAAYAFTALAVVCVYRGIIRAARAQDESPRLARWDGLRPRGR